MLSWVLSVLCVVPSVRERFARFLGWEEPTAGCRVVFPEICPGEHLPSAQPLSGLCDRVFNRYPEICFLSHNFWQWDSSRELQKTSSWNGQHDTEMLQEPVPLQSCCS